MFDASDRKVQKGSQKNNGSADKNHKIRAPAKEKRREKHKNDRSSTSCNILDKRIRIFIHKVDSNPNKRIRRNHAQRRHRIPIQKRRRARRVHTVIEKQSTVKQGAEEIEMDILRGKRGVLEIFDDMLIPHIGDRRIEQAHAQNCIYVHGEMWPSGTWMKLSYDQTT